MDFRVSLRKYRRKAQAKLDSGIVVEMWKAAAAFRQLNILQKILEA